MKIFDLHQDLMLHMLSREHYGQNEQTSWVMLEDSAIELVVATAFPDPVSGNQADGVVNKLITDDINRYLDFLAANKTSWQLVEAKAHLSSVKKKLLLHIEGLNALLNTEKAVAQLALWHALGVRSIGPWWNIDNALGGGTNSPTTGLTAVGVEVVRWIEKKSIILDLAHASRQTFWDVAKLTTRPLYVSHGNVDKLCPSPRNYTDEQLRLIAETDGVIGVFFPATFTVGKGSVGSLQDVIRHVDYLRDLIGVRHIALGSDFGGIVSGTLDGLRSVADLPALLTALSDAGYTTQDISAVCHQNAHRILDTHLS